MCPGQLDISLPACYVVKARLTYGTRYNLFSKRAWESPGSFYFSEAQGAAMKVIIAGSREIEGINVEAAVTASGFRGAIDEVVSGGAMGVDRAGEDWAALSHIPVKIFSADWARFGKSADVKRNEQMVEYADALVIIWNGKSAGLRSLRDCALRHGLKVFVQTVA
jgi:hypothetical protein